MNRHIITRSPSPASAPERLPYIKVIEKMPTVGVKAAVAAHSDQNQSSKPTTSLQMAAGP